MSQLDSKLNPKLIAIFLGVVATYLALQSLLSEYLLEMFLTDVDSIVVAYIDLLSVNLEEAIPTWFATILLFLAAVMLGWITAVHYQNNNSQKTYWLGLTLIFLYLSMDEGAVIHEIISDPLQEVFNTTGYLEFAWLIAFVPLVIIFVLFYARFLFKLPPRTRNQFILAGAIYVGGAVVVEAISANRYASDGGISFPYLAIATVEEWLEMMGVIIFIYALLLYAAGSGLTAVFTVSDSSGRGVSFAKLRGWKRPLTIIIAIILITNIALIYWSTQQSQHSAHYSGTFYEALSEEYANQGVIILQINETLSLENPAAPAVANSLLTLFDDVLVVTFPNEQISIAFASSTLPFTQAKLIDHLAQDNQSDYVIHNTATLGEIARQSP